MLNYFKKALSGALSFGVIATVLPAGFQITVAPQAVANSPVIVPLGQSIDPHTGQVVDGIKIIHYKKGHAKPDNPGGGNGKGNGGGGGGGDEASTCYAYIANGAHWNNVEDYLVDPTNSDGLDEATIVSVFNGSVGDWEAETSGDIFGANVAGVVDGADESSPDGKNEVLFGSIDSPGAIAVTIVWGVFKGPPSGRGLSEWDMVFDQDDYDWSLTGEAGKMDFHNIAAHELGHALGLSHPSDTCVDETMYRFADFGETNKRDLDAGDIEGVQSLYGYL